MSYSYNTRRSYRPKTYAEVEDVICTRESDKALLCVIGNQESWVPKSQIDMSESEVKQEGDEGTLVISEWFAAKIGAI